MELLSQYLLHFQITINILLSPNLLPQQEVLPTILSHVLFTLPKTFVIQNLLDLLLKLSPNGRRCLLA